MASQKYKYSVCILAGGEGRRFGGLDKGFVKYRGKPLIEHAIEAFADHTNDLTISANRNLEQYKKYGYSVVCDLNKTYAGPLAGTLTACTQSKNEWLLVIACDHIGIDNSLANAMHELAESDQTKLVITNDGDRNQPLPMLLHTSLKNTIGTFLGSGDRKVGLWQALQKPSILKSEQLKQTKNINTPEDL
ncbi:MAG: molybdenum cofactor guanylyltransferase [Proteobacteria bacterium]|jgi:molybdenum cofactor guanylyltransferase|nr:molybdenum cofactor guanylyltransferase [Pseudomonadota bacterium]